MALPFDIPPGTLEALLLFAVRTSGLVLATPIFGEALQVSAFKAALIAILTGLFYAVGGEPLAGEVDAPLLALFALRELLIGLALGMVLQVVMLAVRVAGHMVGNEMAFTMSNVVDPLTGVNTPTVTRVYETAFLLGLLALDGHHLLLRGLGRSFGLAPVGEMDFEPGLSTFVWRLFADMFAAGIAFAAPVLVVLALASILIGLLARAVPQLNVIEVGFTLRIGLGLGSMYVFAPLLAPALDDLYRTFEGGLEGVLVALTR